MSTGIEVKNYKLKALPNKPIPNAILYIKADGDSAISTYITDVNGIPYPLKDDGSITNPGVQTVFNTDGTISIIGTTDVKISIQSDILDTINSAVQPEDLPSTKVQFNNQLVDGNFLFVGDVNNYTDEQAQDAVGNTLTDTTTIDFNYNDAIPSISASVKPNSITPTELADNINLTEFVNNVGFENTSQLNTRDTNNRNRVNHTGTQAISTVVNLQSSLDAKENKVEKNIANGYAGLDVNGKILKDQLPILLTWGYVTATNGGSRIITADEDALLVEGGLVANYTVTLPTLTEAKKVTIAFNASVTNLTINAGAVIDKVPTSAKSYDTWNFIYDPVGNQWSVESNFLGDLGAQITALPNKGTITDIDTFAISDGSASSAPKKVTALNLYNNYVKTKSDLLYDKLWEVETLTPVIGGQNTRIAFRKGENGNRGFPLMVYFHGASGNQNDPFVDPDQKRITDQFIQAGYMVASSNGAGDSWGNQAGIDAYDALITYLQSEYNITKIILIGQSMGGIVSLNLMSSTSHNIDAWYGIYPATNLRAQYDIGFAGAIQTAYGFSNPADYDTATAGHDPNLKLATDFPKIKYRMTASPEDTVVDIDDNSLLFNTRMDPYALITQVVVCIGEHGDPSHFILDDALTFFDRDYIKYPTAITLPSGTSTVGVATTEFVTDGLNGKQDILTDPVTGTGTSGYVPFWISGSDQSADVNFIWDNTNKRLGLATASPNRILDLKDGMRINGSTPTIDFGNNFDNQIWLDATTFNIKTGGTERFTINKSTGAVTIPNLAGTGTVVADASGNLSAQVLISNTNTSSSTLTLTSDSAVNYYVFEGSTATWTLPNPIGNTTKKVALYNTGSGTVIVNSNGGLNVIYNGGLPLVNTYSLLMGSNVELYSNGSKWIVI